jgi:4-hydroxybenzoate polyprenyltransferase
MISAQSRSEVPLCVDLDGTLIHTDLLLESFLLLLKKQPLAIFYVIGWLFKGKAYLKEQIASRIELRADALPYNAALLDKLRQEKEQGRMLVLATASHRSLADKVATHLNLFDAVHASDGQINLSSSRKRDCLIEHYGAAGFDYIGNSQDDVKVWQAARHALLVDTSPGVKKTLEKTTPVFWENSTPKNTFKAVVKGIRVHQWLKNALIFVPLIVAHQFADPVKWLQAGAAFIAFSMCASSVYVLNDLLDLDSDRRHASKRKRPFASGALQIHHGVALTAVLLLASIVLSLTVLPIAFAATLALYYAITVFYSFWAKGRVALDVLLLAGLYTMRLIAGGAATDIELSLWLLAFSMFVFLSLAFVKRYAEMLTTLKRGEKSASGRGYTVDDMPLIQSMGSSAGYIAVMVLALYINHPDLIQTYSHPKILWAMCPLLLFWITRLWIKTSRGEMHEDPVVFAAKDTLSRLIILLILAAMWLAI